jgi:hypothetical protein
MYKDVADAIDMLAALPASKHRLKHNPKCTPQQKRAIRKAFNESQVSKDIDVCLATVNIGGVDRKMIWSVNLSGRNPNEIINRAARSAKKSIPPRSKVSRKR